MIDEVLKIIGILSTITIPILLFVLNKKNEKLRIIQNKISDIKHQTYTEIYSIFFDLILDTKGLKKLNQNTLTKGILEIKKKLLLYGTDDIIRKFFEWEKSIQNPNLSVFEKTNIYFELFILIRSDISSEKTNITTDEIMISIMSNNEEYLKLKRDSIS